MKKLVVLFLVMGAIFSTGCSQGDDQIKKNQEFKLTDQEYQLKVIQMNAIFDHYEAYDDGTNSYDYNAKEHRLAIEKLDLKDLEDFLKELHSEEGLKIVDETFIIQKKEKKEGRPNTKATTKYQVVGKHTNAIIGKSSSFVDFDSTDYERIAFVNAGAT